MADASQVLLLDVMLHNAASLPTIELSSSGVPRVGEVVCLDGLPELAEHVEAEAGVAGFIVHNVRWQYDYRRRALMPIVEARYLSDGDKPWEVRRKIFEGEGWQADTGDGY